MDTKISRPALLEAQDKTGLKDAVRTAVGKSMGEDLVIACIFSFIGGSMGSVVGEKIRAADYALKRNYHLSSFPRGGARMMEAALSWCNGQTSAKLVQLAKTKIPTSLCPILLQGYYSIFAMLGDINISEPGAL